MSSTGLLQLEHQRFLPIVQSDEYKDFAGRPLLWQVYVIRRGCLSFHAAHVPNLLTFIAQAQQQMTMYNPVRRSVPCHHS